MFDSNNGALTLFTSRSLLQTAARCHYLRQLNSYFIRVLFLCLKDLHFSSLGRVLEAYEMKN